MTLSLEELVRANNNGTLDGALQSRGELPLKVLEEVLVEVVKLKRDLKLVNDWHDALHGDYD